MKIERRRRHTSFEPTIPLINVVFLLLIFLMIAGSPGKSDPFRIDPVRSIAEQEPGKTQQILYISSSGEVSYGVANGKAEALAAIATDIAQETFNELIIKADRDLDTVMLIELSEDLKAIGVLTLVLLTQRTN